MTRERTPSDDLRLHLARRQRARRSWRVSPAWAAVAVGLGMLGALYALWLAAVLP